ncbi:MAG: ABC transporter substrate-binding protein [Ktedonobacteraceae bacterium]
MKSLTHSKRHVAVLVFGLLTALSLLFSACGGTSSGNGGSPTATVKPSIAAPTDLITAGTLTVGSDTTYPPQEFLDTTTNKYTGFDVDLITEMAARMGLKANIVKTDFTTIIDNLVNKRFDVVISAVTISDERKKKADFIPYFNAGESLLVAKGNPMNLKAVADLCGLNIGVQKATVEQDDLTAGSKDCVSKGKKAINLTILASQTDVVQLLVNKRVVATYQDSPVTDYFNKLNPGQFEVGGAVVNAAQEGIAVRKGDTAMLTPLQAAFNAVKSDGTYTKIVQKWGVTSGALAMINRRLYLV